MSAQSEEPLLRLRMSWDEYLQLPEPQERPRAEWVDGWVRESPLMVAEVLSRATRSEDTVRKSMEYAEGGVGQYWILDPELRTLAVPANHDGAWDVLLHLDDDRPAGDVELAGVTVPLDLTRLLRT